MKISKMLIMVCFVAGCAMPNTVVKTVDTRPGIIIEGASDRSQLFIDGINMGNATQYDGNPQVLTVEAGVHKVTITSSDIIVYEKMIFVESETKKIIVH